MGGKFEVSRKISSMGYSLVQLGRLDDFFPTSRKARNYAIYGSKASFQALFSTWKVGNFLWGNLNFQASPIPQLIYRIGFFQLAKLENRLKMGLFQAKELALSVLTCWKESYHRPLQLPPLRARFARCLLKRGDDAREGSKRSGFSLLLQSWLSRLMMMKADLDLC